MGRPAASAAAPSGNPQPRYGNEGRHSPASHLSTAMGGSPAPVAYPPEAVNFPSPPPAPAAYPPEAVNFPPPPPATVAYPPEPVKFPPPPPAPVAYPPVAVNFPPPPPAPSVPPRRQFVAAPPPPALWQNRAPYGYQGQATMQSGNPWSSGLFDFDRDTNNAVLTALLPCVTFGQIVEALEEGRSSCTLGSIMYAALMPLIACAVMGTSYRQFLRRKYNLVQAPAEDCIVHLFCPCCALCQEYRELQARGIDPSLGWMGNLAKQQEMTTPPVTQTMNM